MRKNLFVILAMVFLVSCVTTKGSAPTATDAPKRDLASEIKGVYVPPNNPEEYVSPDRIKEFKYLVNDFKRAKKEEGISANSVRKINKRPQLMIIERCSKKDYDNPEAILIKHKGDPSAAFIESCEYDTYFGPLDPKFNIKTSRHFKEENR